VDDPDPLTPWERFVALARTPSGRGRGLGVERAQRVEVAGGDGGAPPLRVDAAWVQAKLARLEALLARDPVAAKAEIAKHLDGGLVVAPRAPRPGERWRAEISGRVRHDSLLGGQEAVCTEVVAGARAGGDENRSSLVYRFAVEG